MTEQQLLSALTQAAEASGLPAALQHYYGGNIRLSLPFTKRTCAASIDELTLSVRSQNALKRAGLFTVGAIVQALEVDELGKIRNLGRKSMAEIKTRVTVFGFEALSGDGKQAFFRSLIAENPEKTRSLCAWEQ
ncbi:MAG: DNA-directed RNA polymerase subunit alpha C-terminal domain-containing protein [Oscillospiraceae bacterium]|nr:DNA-directed RNA polymerase subunit alpha C-terminal domain-containing protein [Oscillospiraceae bacterium]